MVVVCDYRTIGLIIYVIPKKKKVKKGRIIKFGFVGTLVFLFEYLVKYILIDHGLKLKR